MSDGPWVHAQRDFGSSDPCRGGVSQPESGEKPKIRLAKLDIGVRREHSRMMPRRVREGTDFPRVTKHVDEKPEDGP